MSQYYELIGQTAVPLEGDVLAWAQSFERSDRRVQTTLVLGACVSTIFLGIDHSWGSGPPLLFETMIFWPGEHGYEQARSSTWKEAEAMHAGMCRVAASPGRWLAFCCRSLAEGWREAWMDWRYRWKELRGIPLTELEQLTRDLRGLE